MNQEKAKAIRKRIEESVNPAYVRRMYKHAKKRYKDTPWNERYNFKAI